MYALSEEMEMKARISTLARKVEELEGKQLHEVHAATENPAQSNPCTNCQSLVHPAAQCPMAPSMKDLMSECAKYCRTIHARTIQCSIWEYLQF